MSRRSYKKGSTSVSVNVFIGDSTLQGTTRGGKTGLVFNTAGLKAYFSRTGSAAAAISLATLANNSAAWSSGGFVEIDATNMPGVYRLDIPDAALATGVGEVEIIISGATGACVETIQIDLTNQEVGDLNAAAIALATFAAGAIDATVLAANAIGASQLAANAITSTKIADAAITAAKLTAAITDLAADPGATPSIVDAIALMYMALRNASTVTATSKAIKNNAGSTILSSALSDDGTTTTKAKLA